MSFFVKCPKQRPVQGRFKKVHMYGAIEDKGMVLCTILKRPTTMNVEGITKKDIHMLLIQCDDFYPRRINAQHFLILFSKVAKIARKRLFTS